jgi:uncharacterized radical SAM protein YgiQ
MEIAEKLFPSILMDSNADFLVYGMGEKPIREIAEILKNGGTKSDIRKINQIAFYATEIENNFPTHELIMLPSFEACLASKKAFAEAFRIFEIESNKIKSAVLVQPHGDGFIIVNPPNLPTSTQELDEIYALPYARAPHPKYNKRGAIPAWEMIKNSINIHRGCFGGCSFCAIAAHQGKQVVSRSEKSIMDETLLVVNAPDFKGHITDLGGPSANMYKMQGKNISQCEKCIRPSCIYPSKCSNLNSNHFPLITLYKQVRQLPNVKHVTIGSGIRYDLLMSSNEKETRENGYREYLENLIQHHVSGRLKVAPEHTSDEVLKIMRKPSFTQFKQFKQLFDQTNRRFGLRQQLIPYFISSHPASNISAMANLAEETASLGYRLEQIQDFTPTPMTLSTTIYYCGFDPYTLKPVYTAKNKAEKQMQQLFFFWYKPENRSLIERELVKNNLGEVSKRIFGRNKTNFR